MLIMFENQYKAHQEVTGQQDMQWNSGNNIDKVHVFLLELPVF